MRVSVVIKAPVVAMVDGCSMLVHLVSDEAVAAGRSAGLYTALCRATVLPGSLTEDSDRHCQSCRDRVAAR